MKVTISSEPTPIQEPEILGVRLIELEQPEVAAILAYLSTALDRPVLELGDLLMFVKVSIHGPECAFMTLQMWRVPGMEKPYQCKKQRTTKEADGRHSARVNRQHED